MKKRFKGLSVFLVVALLLSLSATVAAATTNSPKDFTLRYNYWANQAVYIDYIPGGSITNAVAYTGVDMTDAEHGHATTIIKRTDGNKATSIGTNVTNYMLCSNLVGIAAAPKSILCIDHYAGHTYNGTAYSWQIHCYNTIMT